MFCLISARAFFNSSDVRPSDLDKNLPKIHESYSALLKSGGGSRVSKIVLGVLDTSTSPGNHKHQDLLTFRKVN